MSDSQDWFHEPEVKEGYALDFYPVRWKPYHPKHTQQTGKKGRWQRMNEYAGWENCEKPDSVYSEAAMRVGVLFAEQAQHEEQSS